ncbi:SIMPL domain-containing protein [Paenibacillus sp. EPM92]|uniref:SIMPL domain-containing protein n=1 Tax=Paenibacillus sp. EPM92 TaxID=1561195 RepID=UPI00191627E7|nr:SIMPL domain-containing protein [Paenibacillus sp. EPM92]
MYYNQPLSPAPPAPASLYRNNRHIIEVSGEGTVSAAPDRAVIELGAITENTSLRIAQRENAATVTDVINSLLQLNIPKERIQTVAYRIEMQYSYEDGKQIFTGYRVTHLLQITLDQIDRTGLVVDTAVEHGANSVLNIQFSMAHPAAYYHQALSLAVKNAESKAMTIATTLAVTLVKYPDNIQEEARTREPIPYQALHYAATAPTPIQPGQLKITASVRAQYSYV